MEAITGPRKPAPGGQEGRNVGAAPEPVDSPLVEHSLLEAIIAPVGLLLVGTVGILDLLAPRELDFHVFYLLGCAVLGWKAGPRSALTGSLFAGLAMWLDEMRSSPGTIPHGILFLNVAFRITGLAVIGWLAARAGNRTRHLDRLVQRRTSKLQHEVDQHRETAEKWHEMAQLFRQLTENITEVFWVSDPSRTRFHYLSPGFEQIWMQSCRDAYVNPDTWIESIHVEDRQRVALAIKQSVSSGGYDELYRVVRPDQSVRWIHDRAFPVRNDNHVYRFAGIAEDITESRKAQEMRARLEAQVMEISDREQARIGQDIHDGLCQQLVGAAFAANSLKQSLSASSRPELEKAGRICDLLDTAITEARRVSRGLCPVRLSAEGLCPALEELAAAITSSCPVKCVFEMNDSGLGLPLATAIHLYRIAQEAVNNAVKHSQATTVKIRLSSPGEALLLEIIDDGRGFSRDIKSRGMGLHSMQYRARTLGANLRIEAGEKGTSVICRLVSSSS